MFYSWTTYIISLHCHIVEESTNILNCFVMNIVLSNRRKVSLMIAVSKLPWSLRLYNMSAILQSFYSSYHYEKVNIKRKQYIIVLLKSLWLEQTPNSTMAIEGTTTWIYWTIFSDSRLFDHAYLILRDLLRFKALRSGGVFVHEVIMHHARINRRG